MEELEQAATDEKLFKLINFLGKSSLSVLPGGSILAELLTLVIADPAGRRRDRFLTDIAARLQLLEQQGRVSLDELADDDRVSAFLLQAVQVAQRSTGEGKYEALRNAALNGTCNPDKRSLTPVVIGLLDRLTDNHIYIMTGIKHMVRPSDPRSAKTVFHQQYWGTTLPLTQGLVATLTPVPGVLDPGGEVFKVVWSDLVGLGLIQETTGSIVPDQFRREAPRFTGPSVQITPLARLLLDHIASQGDGLQ